MEIQDKLARLAVNGGARVRNEPFPERGHVGAEERAAVAALFDSAIASGRAIRYLGPEEESFCREFADALGGGFTDAVNSGTSAVYVALRALEVEPFTEVIVPPITDAGGIMPVPLLNCIPVVADSAPGTFNVGPEQIEELISPLTSAIIVAHIMGEPADMPGILSVARRQGVPVIEDCAQALGARLNGRALGSFGDIAAFSTMFGKHICTGGQGGLVFTRDAEVYQRIRWAADRGKPFGLPEGSSNVLASLNFNLDEIGSAIGREQLRKLPAIVAARRCAVARIADAAESFHTVGMPKVISRAEPSWWYLRLRYRAEAAACDKETFCDALCAEGLAVNPRYAMITTDLDWFRNRRVFGSTALPWTAPQYKGDAEREFPCPNARAARDEHFILSFHESWTEQDLDDAIAILAKVDAAYARA